MRNGSNALEALSSSASTAGFEYEGKLEPSRAIPAVVQLCLKPDGLGSVTYTASSASKPWVACFAANVAKSVSSSVTAAPTRRSAACRSTAYA